MGSPATASQISAQAKVMQETQRDISDNLVAFDRYTAKVGQSICKNANCPNGHTTEANAIICGQRMAMGLIQAQPTPEQAEALLATLEVQILTFDRFLGKKADGTTCGCKFGHKDQTSAIKCIGGHASKSAQTLKTTIKVTSGGKLDTTTPTTTTPAQTTPTVADKDKPAQSRLKSGSQGNTGRA